MATPTEPVTDALYQALSSPEPDPQVVHAAMGVGAGRNRKPASGLKKLKIGPQRGSFDLYAAPWGGGSSLTADRLHTL